MTFRNARGSDGAGQQHALRIKRKGVWTDKGSKIFKIVNELRAGVVWAQILTIKFDPTSPFGGIKRAAFGREGGLHGFACRI